MTKNRFNIKTSYYSEYQDKSFIVMEPISCYAIVNKEYNSLLCKKKKPKKKKKKIRYFVNTNNVLLTHDFSIKLRLLQ